MQQAIRCWCGNDSLSAFSAEYLLCKSCHTLASFPGLINNTTTVVNDDEDFYGKNYWLNHQSDELGQADIFKRARNDLSERCLYWLRSLLHYKLPPAKLLEIGSAHGGFTSLLQNTGFDASGLELSPFIAEFAHKTFDIPMYVGPIEEQAIPDGSLDIIILMDVLEHLPDPVVTVRKCLSLLKQDGILVIQTPAYPARATHKQLVKKQHPFLNMLQPQEHLYLFSVDAMQPFFKKVTSEALHVYFEPAIFAHYDMYMVVSREKVVKNSQAQIDDFLSQSAKTRFVQSMLDIAGERDRYIKLYQQADADRIARLAIIKELEQSDGALEYVPII
ncbi:MAG: class I SAM-dependent methyltransferase [Gammaproteobacteria bacterium]|nr:class I SAM-dependent methyltransferase [Gammaproteobacteria bacterium]